MANKILETLEYVEECRRRGIENYNASKSDSASELSGNATLEEVVDCVRGDLAEIGYSRPADFPNTKELILSEQPVTVDGVKYIPYVACVISLDTFSFDILRSYIPFQAYKRYGDSNITIENNTSTTNNINIPFDQNHLFDTEEGDFSYVIFYLKDESQSISDLFYCRNISSNTSENFKYYKFVLAIKELYLLYPFYKNTYYSNPTLFDFYSTSIPTNVEYLYVKEGFKLKDSQNSLYFSQNSGSILFRGVAEIEIGVDIQVQDGFSDSYYFTISRITSPNNSKIILGNSITSSTSIPDFLTSFSHIGNTSFSLCRHGHVLKSFSGFPDWVTSLSFSSGNTAKGYRKIDLTTATSLKTIYVSNISFDEIVNMPRSITSININDVKYVELFNDFDVSGCTIKGTAGMNEKFVQQLPGWLKDHSSDGATRTITVGALTVAKFTEEQLAEITRKGWTIA